jgi:hypothetical protein
MSLKEMRDELRALRKESVKPVSKMKKTDIAMELEKLRGKRETVPPVASTEGPKPKKMEPKIADVKVAKEHEFPTKPASEEKKKGGKKLSGMAVGKSAVADGSAKKSKMEKLREMLEAMGSDDE